MNRLFGLALFMVVVLTTPAFCTSKGEPYTVMVLLEAKPGKEAELKTALLEVAEKSRSESSCLGYHIYQDSSMPTKFGLYEQWKSPEMHQEQFSKPYIQAFAQQAESLLASPYQGIFGYEVVEVN